MSTITVRNLPDDVHDELRRRARDARRSVNQEVIRALETYVAQSALEPDLERIRALRSRVRAPVDEDTLTRYRAEGRARRLPQT